MKHLVLALILIIVFISSAILNSQTRNANREYKLQYGFGEKILTTYKMTYTINVTRTYKDDKTKNFYRKIELYLSYWRPSANKDGFAEVRTVFDSVIYEYRVDKEIYQWSSHNYDDILTNADFLSVVFPIVGRAYYTTISPYFDVAKIEGEFLTEHREHIQKLSDTLIRAINSKANSDMNLLFYSDMNKDVIKNGRFAVDSTWQSKFTIPIEGIRYTSDTAATTFYLYDGKNFYVKAEMKDMYPNTDDRNCVIGIDKTMLSVDSTSKSEGS
jgi:hypothetical protein